MCFDNLQMKELGITEPSSNPQSDFESNESASEADVNKWLRKVPGVHFIAKDIGSYTVSILNFINACSCKWT